jgi:hypothetical protein
MLQARLRPQRHKHQLPPVPASAPAPALNAPLSLVWGVGRGREPQAAGAVPARATGGGRQGARVLPDGAAGRIRLETAPTAAAF